MLSCYDIAQYFLVPPSPSTDLTTNLAALSNYTDEQLWAVVYQRLAWPQAQRLHELSAQTKRERLTANEQHELDHRRKPL